LIFAEIPSWVFGQSLLSAVLCCFCAFLHWIFASSLLGMSPFS